MRYLLRMSFTAVLFVSAWSVIAEKPQRVPDIEFKDLAGHSQRLSGLRGSITVVNFWATWCAPCREELPRFSALNRQYASKGVRFVAISADEAKDRGKIAPYFAGQHIAIDAWTGADLSTLDRLHLGNALPATIVLDAQGMVIGRIEGEAKDADVTGYLDWLLGDRTAPPPPPAIKRV